MKLAFSTLGCPRWDTERIADFAGSAGFDGVELRAGPDGVHLSPDAPVREADRVGEIFRARGTPVFALMAYTAFGSARSEELAANRDRLLHVLDLAKAVGAEAVRTFVGRIPKGGSRGEVLARAAEHLIPCCAKAERLGVRLGVETHDDWCAEANLRALREAIGPGAPGIIWDVANALGATGRPVAEQFAAFRGALLYCHLKDFRKLPDGKVQYVPVGTGSVPLKEVVGLLRGAGLEVFLSFEHEKMWHAELPEPEEALPQYVKFMRALEAG